MLFSVFLIFFFSFSLFLVLDRLYLPVFQFTSPLFWRVLSAFDPIYVIIDFSYFFFFLVLDFLFDFPSFKK